MWLSVAALTLICYGVNSCEPGHFLQIVDAFCSLPSHRDLGDLSDQIIISCLGHLTRVMSV